MRHGARAQQISALGLSRAQPLLLRPYPQRSAVARQEMPRHAVLFNHAHNEWLDMFAKRGLLGVLALAAAGMRRRWNGAVHTG